MHSSELRWTKVQQDVSDTATALIDSVQFAEKTYQELLEAYQYAGGTAEAFAGLLFPNETATPPTAEEIEKATDARDAMIAAHDAFTALDFAALRRMS